MEFWLDTADVKEIERFRGLDLCDGVTTNPALLAGMKHMDIKRIVKAVAPLPISLPLTTTLFEEMSLNAESLQKMGENVVIKVPCTWDGYKFILDNGDRFRYNVTMVFHPAQAIPFTLAEVDYLSFFMERQSDFGVWPTRFIRGNDTTKIIAASIRTPDILYDVCEWADVVTVPPDTWDKVLDNPMTLHSERRFLEAFSDTKR